ncbi:MAG: aminotransferase class V-fold PLP-dependent enzyme [Vicinamibacterales bacterium]
MPWPRSTAAMPKAGALMFDEYNEDVIARPEVQQPVSPGVTRRELFQIGNALALPVLIGSVRPQVAEATGPLTPGPKIYQSIGVEPIINCRGTFTILGGSVELPEVRAAMDAASKYYVQIDELADGVGQRLAELTGAEWGMVSAGCAAGMKHVTAACVTGGNPEKLVRIPDLTGFARTEVIIPRSSRNSYDAAVRNIGVTVLTVDTLKELENAISPRTAMIYLLSDHPGSGALTLSAVAGIAKPKQIPILVDAAAEILTIPNVHLQQGATVVAYSGGKAIRGPQCAGVLLGRKDLLMSAWQASAPHHGPGRDNKVGREEILGMLAAVEAWKKRDHAAEWKTWLSWLGHVSNRVSTIDGITTAVSEPEGLGNRSPSLVISWDATKLNVSGEDVAEELAKSSPRVAVGTGGGGGRGAALDPGLTSISVTAWMMQPGDDKVAAERIHAVLSRKRSPRTTTMAAPATNLTGRWDVDIEFFSSRSQHAFSIEQNGNWLRGTHQGDFAAKEMVGEIEGDQVKLRSTDRRPAANVTFTFAGSIANNTMSGMVYMGEYLNAKFSAKRRPAPETYTRIRVPSGRPLAT